MLFPANLNIVVAQLKKRFAQLSTYWSETYIVLKSVGRILVSWENVLLNAEIFE